MIKRKVSLILVAGFLLLLGILGYLYKVSNSDEHQLLEDIERTIERHQEKIAETSKEMIENEETVEETFVPEPIKEFFSEAFQLAKEIFQHQEIRIVALGDSLTQGVGDETDQGGYIGIIHDALHTNLPQPTAIIDNFGKRGQRTGQLLTRLHDETEQELESSLELADIILVTIGANDIMEIFKQNILDLTMEPFLEEQPRYEQRLNDILNTLNHKNEHAKIYLLGFYNPFAEYFADIEELDMIVNDWNEINKTLAESYHFSEFIPIKDLFETADDHLFADDHFHPNRRGYELIADRVLQYLIDHEG